MVYTMAMRNEGEPIFSETDGVRIANSFPSVADASKEAKKAFVDTRIAELRAVASSDADPAFSWKKLLPYKKHLPSGEIQVGRDYFSIQATPRLANQVRTRGILGIRAELQGIAGESELNDVIKELDTQVIVETAEKIFTLAKK